MTGEQRLHLEPSKWTDSTPGAPGLIASEIMAEEELLILKSRSSAADYEATNENPIEIIKSADGYPDDGYAIHGTGFYMICVAIYLSAFLSALDSTVVTTLLTAIASDLKQVPNMSWLATAYLLSSAAFQPLFGKISDIFGRKAVLLACCVFFSIGCFICSFKSFAAVILGRFITGIGGSGFNTVGTISMSDIIPLRDRGVYQGIANLAFLAGAASGGILGGLINDLFGWRYVFSLQVPLVIIIGFIFFYSFKLPDGSPGLGSKGDIKSKLKRVDFLGSFFLVLALICLLLAASMVNRYFSFVSVQFGSIIFASLMLFGAFVYVELYIAPEPILPITLMSERTILASSLTNWFGTMSCFTYLFYYPLYLNTVIQLTSSQAGLRIVSNFLGVGIGSLGAGLYMKKTGRYYWLIITTNVIFCVGALFMHLLSPKTGTFWQLIIMFIPGFSTAVMLTVTLLALIAAAPAKYQAGITSVQYTFRSTGSTLGVSIATALFQNGLQKSLSTKISEVVSDPAKAAKYIHKALKDAEYSRIAPEPVKNAIISSYDVAVKNAFTFGMVSTIMCLLISTLMREHRLHTSVNRD